MLTTWKNSVKLRDSRVTMLTRSRKYTRHRRPDATVSQSKSSDSDVALPISMIFLGIVHVDG